MRALVVATPKFPIVPEQLPAMIEGALAWHDRYQEHFDAFGSFIGGGGFAAPPTGSGPAGLSVAGCVYRVHWVQVGAWSRDACRQIRLRARLQVARASDPVGCAYSSLGAGRCGREHDR